MKTVGELLTILNYYKEHYPEFEKYGLCINVADDDDFIPELKGIGIYINSDIGQVEIYADDESI